MAATVNTAEIRQIQGDLGTLKVGQAATEGKIDLVNVKLDFTKADVLAKHLENRKSIHDFKNTLQDVVNTVTELRVNMAKYSIIAGIITGLITALAIEGIKVWFKDGLK